MMLTIHINGSKLFLYSYQAYLWDKNEEMVSWYQEQTNTESIVSRNVNSVRRDAIISTISKMLEVNIFNSY